MAETTDNVQERPARRNGLRFLIYSVLGLLAGFWGYRAVEALQLTQPYKFNHAAHYPMNCVICHSGARSEVHSGLPPFSTCMKCHATSPLKDKASLSVWQEAEKSGALRWRKLTSTPNHVYFSHRRHTEFAKLDCQTCHGDMPTRTSPPMLPMKRVSMKACRDCHRKNNQTTDCAHCHR